MTARGFWKSIEARSCMLEVVVVVCSFRGCVVAEEWLTSGTVLDEGEANC
jgi:hypothetical protein